MRKISKSKTRTKIKLKRIRNPKDLDYQKEYIEQHLLNQIVTLKYHKKSTFITITGILKVEYSRGGITRYNVFSLKDSYCYATFNDSNIVDVDGGSKEIVVE